ncbi:MAG: aldo/keto reductase [Sphingomicrobium sp.]
MLDDYVTFGRSGLRISRFGLGAFNFGGDQGWSLDTPTAHRLIARYRELGGNLLDSANSYGGGEAETIIGNYLAADPGSRDRLVLASKFGSSIRVGDPNAGGAGRKAILQTCEQSLRRLRTDRIDLYWMHLWDPLTPMDETLRALDDLVRAGKVLHIGLSNTPAWKIAEAHWLAELRGTIPVAGLQLQYSLLERNIEVEHVPVALAYGMGIAAWSPLKSGALSGRYRKEDSERLDLEGRGAFLARALDSRAETILEVVTRIADLRHVAPAQVALAWLLTRPALSAIMIGAHDVGQLEENAGASLLTLTADELAELDEISAPAIPYPADFTRRAHGTISGGTPINGVSAPPGQGSPSQAKS